MEKSEIKKLIAAYDNAIFFSLSDDEWYTLTNHFEMEMIEEILRRAYECCQCDPDDRIIAQQLEILRIISNAQCNLIDNDQWNIPETNDFSAELSLKIRAGKFLKNRPIEMPAKGNNVPDYEALQSIVIDYASACQQMKDMVTDLHTNATDSSRLMTLLKEKEKELEKYKNLEKELQTVKEENERLKMEQKELGKMSQKLAQKAEHDDLMKVLQTYMNISKRKNAKKRGYIKMVITEMAQSARLTLPEDMLQELDNFDDDNTLDRPAIGEYVAVKNVENEIQNVEANGTGVVKHLNAGNDGY